MKKFNDTMPIYLQLRQEVESAILCGHLKEGEPIQSIRYLAQQYGINPLTVSKAISDLVEEGILVKQRGVGFFVADHAITELRRSKVKDFMEQELKSFVQRALQLGISLSDFIELIRQAYQEEAHANHHGN